MNEGREVGTVGREVETMGREVAIEVRESIDIEALLVRAYREKRVDRLGQGVAARAALGMLSGPRAPGATMGGGEKVDTSSYAARMASEMRTMLLRLREAPDALLALHDAVLALPDFFVEVDLTAGAPDFVVWDRETATEMRHRISEDRECPTIVALKKRRVRRDGEMVEEWVPAGEPRRVAPVVTAALMIVHGRDADRPAVPEVRVTRMRPVYRGADKRAVGHVPEYETPLDIVAEERARHAIWHAGLTILADAFRDAPGLAVTGPHADPAPWERTGVVLKSDKSLQDMAKFKPARRRRRRVEPELKAS